ncbi:MAG: pilus assembly protein N-terminal domain-containing protein, partial [Armatimonadetes bacterium]|nr:pilus assembly protein N-terminal domain-containing protein [Armatimonadota bacterium]
MITLRLSPIVSRRTVLVFALVLLVTFAACALASEALVLITGSSKVLGFKNMRRVVVVDPSVADVVVASRAELVVFGKAQGHTKIYVWDARGRHEYAVTVRKPVSATSVVRRLRDLLPEYVEPRAMGDDAVLL